MVKSGRGCSKMPCESCAVQFSVFKRKRVCSECERYYCAGCLRRGGGIMCAPCRVLSTRPLSRHAITHLKVRDLQCFLQHQNISTRGCVEKDELVGLCVSHVNSAAYRRRGARGGAFSGLKGLTNNINDFLNSAFDIRAPQRDTPRDPQPARSEILLLFSSCFNATHVHATPCGPRTGPGDPAHAPEHAHPADRRFTPTPGGERDVRPVVSEQPQPQGVQGAPGVQGAEVGARRESQDSAHVDTADCLEIEDLDDAGWEFVTTPAEPLSNDSAVLLTTSDLSQRAAATGAASASEVSTAPEEGPRSSGSLATAGGGAKRAAPAPGGRAPAQVEAPGTPQRAASELELHRAPADDADTTSLQDEPMMDRQPESPDQISLERLSEAELERLNVRQLKQLLRRNRVEFRGCLERVDLLQRARTLLRDHTLLHRDIDNLPTEECCKICMAAPLECVLLECGHIAACTRCSKQLAECPICRQYVVRAVRFFRS
ncbi:E3 ubiquitin-protein ligase rififylin [Papilio machaon]|uniref:E3 ubiquitin-protein ligase rififylin n=1 Tax=Papilio machaon TaxID=76193 RepID=UPI001E662B19|nr:E3 ubiquitin-protein ligase rififylin [Papilio machaon]